MAQSVKRPRTTGQQTTEGRSQRAGRELSAISQAIEKDSRQYAVGCKKLRAINRRFTQIRIRRFHRRDTEYAKGKKTTDY